MTRTAAGKRRSHTRVLYDIAQLLGSVDEPDTRLRRVLEMLRESVPFDVCALLEVQLGSEARSVVEPEPPPDERAQILATLEGLLTNLVAEGAHQPAPAPAFPSSVVRTLAVPLVWHAEVRGILYVRRASGSYSESHLRAVAIVSGQLAAYLAMLCAHEQSQSRAREIDAARRAALAAERAKDELLAVMTHQLKNPVAATLAWAQVLVATNEDPTGPALAVTAIERNARVLAKLVDDIQGLAGVASAELRLDPGAVEPVRVLKTVVDDLPSAGPGHSSVIAGASQAAKPSPEAGKGDSHALDGISILLVDDDPDIREAFQMVLELYGATVTVAASAAAAMAEFERSRPDVLLCDVCMPGENGYQLMNKIAARDPALPAAALSAFAELADRGRARAAGFRMQLAKPIEAAELVAVVLDLAGRRSAIGSKHRLSERA